MQSNIYNHVDRRYTDKLRDIQKQYFNYLQNNWDKYDVFIFNAPVGSGKSVCAVTTAKWRQYIGERAAIITPRVMLQDQYSAEFSSIGALKGRSRYICPEYGDCDTGFELCESYCEGCPYSATRAKINEDKVGIFNFYSYMFGQFRGNTLIIDEAHTAFDSISEIYTKHIYRCLEDYGDINTLGEALIYLESKVKRLETIREQLRGAEGQEQEYIKVSKEIASLHTMISGVQSSPKDFYFEKLTTTHRGVKTEALRLQPVTLNSLGSAIFPKNAKIILMSGTFNHLDLRKLGLSGRRVAVIDEPSPIPKANRPVIFEPCANMAFKHQEVSVPIVAKRILELAETEPGKGVIHVTYDLALKFQQYFAGHPRFMFHDNRTKDRVYNEFRATTEPRILVAAGMAEGIDLPYEAGRWQVITKIQYPSLADSLMMYYKDKEPDLYAWLTVRTVVQQCGRICRGPDDYGVTYIFDTCFENLYKYNRKLFPSYFQEGLIFKVRK